MLFSSFLRGYFSAVNRNSAAALILFPASQFRRRRCVVVFGESAFVTPARRMAVCVPRAVSGLVTEAGALSAALR